MKTTFESYTADYITSMIDKERDFAIGLLAAHEMTTAQIASRIKASFGESGAENIARTILREYRL